MEEHARTPYEVMCHRCQVTFALGTKKCIHCGDKLGRRGARKAIVVDELAEIFQPDAEPEEHAPEAKASGRSRLPISPMTLIWVVVIAGSLAQRACQGG